MVYAKPAFLLLLTFVTTTYCVRQTAAPEVIKPTFSSNDARAVYAADLNDPWNRIFRILFTRDVKARISSDFSYAAPFVKFDVRMGTLSLRISKEKFSRAENGDRAIEPLYPTFLTVDGPRQVLAEPLFSEFTRALRDAIAETAPRSIIERALMQSDVWAAHDILYSLSRSNNLRDPIILLNLLRQLIRKLALTGEEIRSLRSNYQDAVTGRRLPDLFSSRSGWLEIELLPHRLHEEATNYRRAARVFVKPLKQPANPEAFVEKLKHNQHLEELEAVGLVVQNLLLDSSGRVVPSPLISDVQFRFYKYDTKRTLSAEVKQYELSRRLLLTDPASGGLVEFGPDTPSYLTSSGNDYDFASSIDDAEAPVVVPLRTRCSQCHNRSLTTLMTYSIHYFPPVPKTRVLKPADQEHTLYVARQKELREDFKSLFGVR